MIVAQVDVTRTLLEQQLKKLNVSTITCTAADQALEHMQKADFFLIEEKMAPTDGMALTEMVRAQGSQAPVVLLSTRPAELEKHPNRAAIQGVLQAPTPRADLLSLLSGFATTPATPPAAPETPPVTERKLRVLAAEDNKTNQLVFRKMIKSLNVDLTIANNGEEAVALYQDNKPDIVFMDISMPRMDGKEATLAIRALEKSTGAHVPVVAMTAHAMEGDSTAILEAGLDHYLTKPLRKPEIIAQIEAVHDQSMLPLQVDG